MVKIGEAGTPPACVVLFCGDPVMSLRSITGYWMGSLQLPSNSTGSVGIAQEFGTVFFGRWPRLICSRAFGAQKGGGGSQDRHLEFRLSLPE